MFEFIRRASPLWGNANFNRLWAAQILSAFGSRITRTALPIIAVSVLSVSPWEAALLAALTYAPYVLAGALGGGFVERGNKTRIMVAMDLFRFAIVIATPVAWYFNLLSFPLLCVLAALAGAASHCSRMPMSRSCRDWWRRIISSMRIRACRRPSRWPN